MLWDLSVTNVSHHRAFDLDQGIADFCDAIWTPAEEGMLWVGAHTEFPDLAKLWKFRLKLDSRLVLVFFAMTRGFVPFKLFAKTTFLEQKLERRFVFVTSQRRGGVARCEHAVTQFQPRLALLRRGLVELFVELDPFRHVRVHHWQSNGSNP